jgi:hypothetical protein
MNNNTAQREGTIKKRMGEASMNVRQIRRETGVSSTTIYAFIKGKRRSWLLDRWFWDRLGLDTEIL